VLRQVFSVLNLLPSGTRRRLVRWVLDRVWNHYIEQDVAGLEQIPEGPCLFICNHLSNADGVTLYRVLRPREVYFLAGVKLQATTLTGVVYDAMRTIPIRPGSPDVEALKHAVSMLKGGQSVLIFPEGTRSRTGSLLRAKKGAGLIARRAGVPIVPVALTGTEKFLPIDEANMGGERAHHARIRVTFGQPFTLGDLEVAAGKGEDERQVLADLMMRRVAQLLPPEYRGVYAQPGGLTGLAETGTGTVRG
jgi:1-acyl-sn-glycerol-3-phosphate acyltransferase